MNQNNFQKAQTLLYVGFVLLAVVVMAAVVMTSLVTIQKTTSYQRKGMDAYQLAMAGIERAKVELSNEWSWPGLDDIVEDDTPNRGTANDETLELGQGQYWVDLEDTIPYDANKVAIVSHGWVGDAHKAISAELEITLACGSCCEEPDQIVIPSDRCIGTVVGASCNAGDCSWPINAVAADGSSIADHIRLDIPTFDSIFGKGTAYDNATSQRICNLLGYSSWCCMFQHVYSWPFDQNVILYDEPAGAWVNVGNTHSSCNKRLSCSVPLPRCSNNLDDDGDCLIDYWEEEIIAPPTQAGLVAYYPFDGNANDASGNGNHGTLQGDTSFDTGIINQAASLDGDADWIDIGNLEANFTSEATITMWIRLNSAAPPSAETGLAYLGAGMWGSYYPEANGSLYSNVFRNDQIGPIANSTFDKSQWHMLTVINEPGTNGYRIYQNTTPIYTGAGENTITLNSGGNEELGRSLYIIWYRYLHGLIDDVRIYNRALDQDEIRDIYYSNPNLIFHTDCTDGVDNDLDGRIDYCLADGSNSGTCDSGCASEDDSSETAHDPGCADALDEDERNGVIGGGDIRILPETWNER